MGNHINTRLKRKRIIINMIAAQTQPSKTPIQMESPDLVNCRLEAVFAKIRPFRQGGIRLEHEEIKGKHIFHNYGHGSSGVSLAYGSAFMSVKSVSTFVKEEDVFRCAVIGSGLIGLLTALQLAKKGFNVTVYTKNASDKKSRNISCRMDEGLWLPFGYDSSNRLNYELLSKISYDYYGDCLKTNRYQSIKKATVYDRDRSVAELKAIIPPFLYNGYKNVEVQYQNGKAQPYIKLQTFKIDLAMLIEELKMEATLRGVKFAEKVFESLDQVIALQEDCIFNCSGVGSRHLFPDPNLKAYIDHAIQFINTSNLNYTLVTKFKDNMRVRINCEGKKIMIRSENLVSANEIDKQFVKELIEETEKFFSQRSEMLKAKL